jgi:Fic family protein
VVESWNNVTGISALNKIDLHPDLQSTCVPIPGRSGCFAVVPPLVPQRLNIPSCYGLLATAQSELQNLGNAIQENDAYAHLLMHMLNRREAVDSSQIEGTKTGFDGLLLHELEASSNKVEHKNKDSQETLAYLQAYMAGADAVHAHGQSAFDQSLLCVMHHTLLEGEPASMPGQIRDRQNFIGLRLETATYVPPPASDIPRLLVDLAQLLQYKAEDVMEVSLLVRAAIAHAQFEAIHPFLDGNGRVGRILLPLMFLAEDQPPIHLATFLKVRKQEYYAALLAVQTKLDWEPWLRLFLECVIASCKHTMQLFGQLQKLQQQWQNKLADAGKRKHAASWRVIDMLLGQPMVSANSIVKKIGGSFGAANQAIADLVELDILRPANDQQRNRAFHAHEVMNVLYTGLDKVLDQVAVLSRR